MDFLTGNGRSDLDADFSRKYFMHFQRKFKVEINVGISVSTKRLSATQLWLEVKSVKSTWKRKKCLGLKQEKIASTTLQGMRSTAMQRNISILTNVLTGGKITAFINQKAFGPYCHCHCQRGISDREGYSIAGKLIELTLRNFQQTCCKMQEHFKQVLRIR